MVHAYITADAILSPHRRKFFRRFAWRNVGNHSNAAGVHTSEIRNNSTKAIVGPQRDRGVTRSSDPERLAREPSRATAKRPEKGEPPTARGRALVCSSHQAEISTDLHPAQPVSLLMPRRDELRGHKTTRQGCTFQEPYDSKAIWPCTANRNEHAGRWVCTISLNCRQKAGWYERCCCCCSLA